jgi:hypothetical protein
VHFIEQTVHPHCECREAWWSEPRESDDGEFQKIMLEIVISATD